jgi:hypothetical protein
LLFHLKHVFSHAPVAVGVNGVTRLSNVLATVKGTLFNLVRDFSKSTENVNVVIPDRMRWVVTMWHFDADALTNYIGEKDF